MRQVKVLRFRIEKENILTLFFLWAAQVNPGVTLCSLIC